MNRLRQMFALRANKLGLLAFFLMAALTVLILSLPRGALSTSGHGNPPVSTSASPLKFQAKLSQTKLVQGSDSVVYLDVSIDVPSIENPVVGTAGASDTIIVLDRSGSMAAPNKMPYAKAAIKSLLARLTAEDRFALIAFADGAELYAPLAYVDEGTRARLLNLVDQIGAAGGTNLSEGLMLADHLLQNKAPGRSRKVVLLSDGEANQGIIEPARLQTIAKGLVQHQSVLSTIGMGLGFNETLMASLADYGMGNYTYLENLAGLDHVLLDDLRQSRQQYAANSVITLRLHPGVELTDAGGYPVSTMPDGALQVSSGQLLAHSQKRLMLSFKLATGTPEEYALGTIALAYELDGESFESALASEDLTVAVVAAERRDEAIGSIDQEVYRSSWLENNFGLLKRKLSESIRSGKKEEAKQVLNEYRNAVQAAEVSSSVKIESEAMRDELQVMDRQIDDVFNAPQPVQAEKQQRLSKSLQYDGRQKQRGVTQAAP